MCLGIRERGTDKEQIRDKSGSRLWTSINELCGRLQRRVERRWILLLGMLGPSAGRLVLISCFRSRW